MSKRTQLLRNMKYKNKEGYSILLGKEECDICIEALEKDIAKDIDIYANGTEHCPSCDANLTGMGFKYCVECGQKLKEGEIE